MRETKVIGMTDCGRFDIIAIFINEIEIFGTRRFRRII
jgi:hypothetical protein